jgi:hypothetical protein
MKWLFAAAACAALVLSACGGGSAGDLAASSAAPARAQGAPLRADAGVTPDQAMDWAEQNYPQYFPAASKQAGSQAPYAYRYYAATNNYLGISTADNSVYIAGNVSGGPITRVGPLSNYSCNIQPSLCNGFSRNIAFWGDSLTPPVAANLQLFYSDRTVFNGGISSQSSFDVLAREQADTAKHGWVTVLWFGHNNDANPQQVKNDMAAAVAALSPGNNRFVVLSLLNKADVEYKGTAMYNTVLQLNADLQAMFPNNYVDVRTALVNAYNPNSPADVTAHANDVPPPSLLHDADHLNNDGSVLVATKVRDFIAAKGW